MYVANKYIFSKILVYSMNSYVKHILSVKYGPTEY